MLNQPQPRSYTMEEEVTLYQLPPPDLDALPGKDQLWWPSWQSLFEDGHPVTGVNTSSAFRSPDGSAALDEHSWTPGAEPSPADSAAIFSPSLPNSSPGRTNIDPPLDGRISKRKAQNRAA